MKKPVTYNEKTFWLHGYKVGKGCADCGYNEHPAALQFDHIEDNKVGNVSTMAGSYGFHKILEEIEKCEVVCANCHSVRTARRRENER